jgi:hypothetical protein
MAIKYRCYPGRKLRSQKIIEADDDAVAVLEADRMLSEFTCTVAERWDGTREVSMKYRF